MKKSKFKSVRFKPFDSGMYYSTQEMWVHSFCLDSDSSCVLKVTDSCIEAYPELFEVEKADREFEDGAYYKAMFASHSVPEIIQRFRGNFQRMGLNLVYIETDFHEIGEKIEL